MIARASASEIEGGGSLEAGAGIGGGAAAMAIPPVDARTAAARQAVASTRNPERNGFMPSSPLERVNLAPAAPATEVGRSRCDGYARQAGLTSNASLRSRVDDRRCENDAPARADESVPAHGGGDLH